MLEADLGELAVVSSFPCSSSGDGHHSEGRPSSPYRPGNARELVGERHGGLVVTAQPFELQGPAAEPVGGRGRLRLGVPEHRACPVNQEHAQIGVTALTDGAEAPPRARGVFAWREAQVAGEVPRRGKARHVADGGDQGRRGEQADARNRAQVADGEGIGGRALGGGPLHLLRARGPIHGIQRRRYADHRL